jgi:DHA1 family multidrug resistance protein-like MFS transporter
VELRSRLVVTVTALTALWAFTNGLFQPLLPVYVASLGGSATDVGIVTAASAVGFILIEPFWGLASDRIGAARPLFVAKLVSAAVFAGYLVRTDLWWIVLLQFVRGLSDVALAPIGRALLTRHVAPARRGAVMGLYATTQTAARSGVGFVGGGIADWLGFRVLFVVCALLSLGSAFLALFGLRGIPNTPPAATAEPAPQRSEARAHDGDFIRRFTTLSVVTGLGHTAMGVRTFVTLYAVTIVGLSASEIGILASIAGAAFLICALPGGRLSDQLGRKPLLVAGYTIAALAPFILAAGLAQSFVALAALAALSATGDAASAPARQAMLSDIAPAGRPGLTIGIYGIAEDVGLLFGPLLGGLIWDRFGPAVALTTFAALYLAAATCAAIALPETRRASLSPEAARA